MAPSPQYPRPDFERPSLTWESLDGPWDFAFDDQDCGLAQKWQREGIPSEHKCTIQVPYAFQMPASGIGKREDHEVIWYERAVTDIRNQEQLQRDDALLVRFGAVDYECSVWANGHFVGSHRGGHVPFDLDVSDAVSGTSGEKIRLSVRVRDSPGDLTQPRGKQYWKSISENIWYTPSSGIWLSVWLESVPRTRLGGSSNGTILRSDDIENGVLHAELAVLNRLSGSKYSVEIVASLEGVEVGKATQELAIDKGYVKLDVPMKSESSSDLQSKATKVPAAAWHNGIALWSPEHPVLYDLTLRLCNAAGEKIDEVKTTTGMRKLEWRGTKGAFLLNNKPYFQALVLDQGYWRETGMTPPSYEALKTDIEISKRMGFNGCRKHQKVEDPMFMYLADRLGYLVWGEMANAYVFDQTYAERFEEEWLESVKRDINHPCIVTWTPNNESWGYTGLEQGSGFAPGNTEPAKDADKNTIEQRNHMRMLYYKTKLLDPSRPINDNCGWDHVLTDLTTYHDYADSEELGATCAKMEGGILGPKAGHPMFVSPIYDGETLLDPGAKHVEGAPVICTEFGGVNIAPSSKDEAGERDWGYTTASDSKDLVQRFRNLVMAVVQGGHTCGIVYTQLTDIEQEVNGLYSIDRQAKVPEADVKTVNEDAMKYYFDHVAPK